MSVIFILHIAALKNIKFFDIKWKMDCGLQTSQVWYVNIAGIDKMAAQYLDDFNKLFFLCG